jgi:hypothetical protein
MKFAPESWRNASRPTRWALIYFGIVLLLFSLAVLEHRVDAEGMGYLPLLVMTTPWSWLLLPLWDLRIWPGGPLGGDLAGFITFVVIAGTANACLLYFLLKWREKKRARLE